MLATPSCLFIAALWPPAGKGLTSCLSCMRCFIVFCHFLIWYPKSDVVLGCINPDRCLLTYFRRLCMSYINFKLKFSDEQCQTVFPLMKEHVEQCNVIRDAFHFFIECSLFKEIGTIFNLNSIEKDTTCLNSYKNSSF